jgi:hypothetical protein
VEAAATRHGLRGNRRRGGTPKHLVKVKESYTVRAVPEAGADKEAEGRGQERGGGVAFHRGPRVWSARNCVGGATMMTAESLTAEVLATLVTSALALQFAAFGWRILREIQLDDENRRTWFLITDWLIIVSMCSVVAYCIVLPLAGYGDPSQVAKAISSAYVVIAAHPINTAAHYRLFSRYGRAKYLQAGRDVPYVSDQEWGTLALTGLALAATFYFVR